MQLHRPYGLLCIHTSTFYTKSNEDVCAAGVVDAETPLEGVGESLGGDMAISTCFTLPAELMR